MKKIFRICGICVCLAGAMLGACAVTKTESLTLYDLGPLRDRQQGIDAAAAPRPLSVAEANVPAWLDSPKMFFRLNYANDQQPRPYAGSRWSMPPGQLFTQRLKSRIGQAGGTVLPASAGAADMPLLRIEADEFTQFFDSPAQSSGRIALRASLMHGRMLIAQKTFVAQAPASTADASGGARALAEASDTIITEMMAWLAGLPSKK